MNTNRAVVVTQYYPPEIGGGSQRSVGFVEELRALGVKVTVVTPFPSYLIKDFKMKFKLYERVEADGVEIFRTFVYASDRGKFLKRMMYYLSFTFSAIFALLFKVDDIQNIITISPPLFNGITGVVIKKIKGARFIFDIGDLWPESAVHLGFLNNKTVIKLAENLERYIYKNADQVNVVTRLTKSKLEQLHPYIKKINYIPNFVKTETVKKNIKEETILTKYNLHGKMVFGYAGNIGSAQGLTIITQAAKNLKEVKDAVFIIIGDGVDREKLEEDIKTYKLSNVLLLPPVSRDEINMYISVFDWMIIPLVKNELFKITIPSKLYESMAAEVPVLLCVDGEARRIMEKYDCGIFIEPENSRMLSDRINEIIENPSRYDSMGKNGRTGAIEEFDRKVTIKKFFDNLYE